MSRANSDTDRGAVGADVDRPGRPVGDDAGRDGHGPALPGAEGQLALPAALGEHLGLDDLAVQLQAAGLEDVLEVGGAVEQPDAEHLPGRLVAVAQVAVRRRR